MKTSPKPRDYETSTLGEFIRERRKQMGLSLRAFAKSASVSVPFMSQIELDQGFPSSVVLERIAAALRVPPAQLRTFDTRVPIDELRRLLQRSPEFRAAMFLLITEIKRHPKKLASIAQQLEAAIHKVFDPVIG